MASPSAIPDINVLPDAELAHPINDAPNRQQLPDDSNASYHGYVPKPTTDFIQASRSPNFHITPSLQSSTPDTPDSESRLPIRLIVAMVTFLASAIVCLALALSPAACSLSLCTRQDVSSLPTSTYIYSPFPFSAPLPPALVTLSVAMISLAMLSFLLRYNSISESQSPRLAIFAASVRRRAFSFTLYTCMGSCILAIVVFIAVGATTRWKTGLAFLLGVLPTIMSAFLTLSASTNGATNTAMALLKRDASPLPAFACATRAASIAPLSSHGFTYAFLVFTYLLLKDVNTLIAFVFGTAITAFTLRVAAAIHTPTARAAGDAIPRFDDVRSPAADLSAYPAAAAAHAAETCVLFSAPVAAAAVLGADVFPYFETNGYALCVWNHLSIDVKCMRYTDAFTRVSFAVSLCRRQGFYMESEYPSLLQRQSNSVFVALPFLFCASTLILMMVSAFLSARTQRDPTKRLQAALVDMPDTDGQQETNGADNQAQGRRRRKLGRKVDVVTPFMRAVMTDQLMRFLISLIAFMVILVISIGPTSTFTRANSVNLQRFQLPSSTSPTSFRQLCRQVAAPNNGLPSETYPRLDFITSSAYTPIDIFGRALPAASRLSWIFLACLIIGLLCSVCVAICSAYTASPLSPYASSLALDGFDGQLPLATGGSGLGSGICVLVVSMSVLLCYRFMGAYGVALCALGATTSLAPASSMSLSTHIVRHALDLLNKSSHNHNQKEKSVLLAAGAGDEMIVAWSNGVFSTIMALSALSLLFVVVIHTGVFASAAQVTGLDATSLPTRHVADPGAGPKADILNINVLSAVLFGVISPFVIAVAAVAGAGSAATAAVAVAAKREIVKRGWWASEELTTNVSYEECGQLAAKITGLGTIGPVSAAAACAMGGVWTDGNEWIGVITGCVVGGIVVSFVVSLVGNRLHGMASEKSLEQWLDSEWDGGNGGGDEGERGEKEEGATTWKWEQVGEERVSGCVRTFVLLFVSGGVVSSETERGNGSRSWWWVVVMVVIWMLVFGAAQFGLWSMVGRLREDAVFSVGEGEARVNMKVVGNEEESGPTLAFDGMGSQSMLRNMGVQNGGDLEPILF